MAFDDVKRSVIDWFKDRKYAEGKAPLIVISVILAACLIWISSFFVGGDSYPMPTQPDSPRDREIRRLTDEIRTDERFIHIAAGPSEESESIITFTGSVYTRADKAALLARIKTLTSAEFTIVDGEIHVLNEP